MPSTITVEDVADLVASVQSDKGPGSFVDLSVDKQEFIALPMLLKKEKVKTMTGRDISVVAITDQNNQAMNVGLFNVDEYNAPDIMARNTIPWRHTTTNYIFDRRESAMNQNDEDQIFDLIETRRAGAWISLAEKMEDNFWGKPATSSDDTTPYGIDTYIVRNASTGFYGGNPSGFTTGVIFDSTVQTRWKNWTDVYVNVTKADAIFRMRKAMTYTQFKSPVSIKNLKNVGSKRVIYTNRDVILKMAELVENQNDNLGNDLASKDGDVYFWKNPVNVVAKLDSDANDPIYGVDWDNFYPVFLKGEHFNESKPYALKGKQHNVVAVDIDSTYNWLCKNRRGQWIINL
jgi:hypothetical protein